MPAQLAAWDTYLALTTGLLPAMQNGALQTDQADNTVHTQLEGMTTRILRYAPLWGERGPMLVAAVASAVRLHRAGERDDLLELLRVMADRLYVISASPTLRRDGHDPAPQ